ncbi:MAG TPA: hypothetical protein VFU81_09825 [Thermomicrobiales bacterium]|nr:hypothetical protein [Thermomicrobiales bacterium]
MDASRFDALLRGWSAGSRRSLLRGLAAGALAGLFGSGGAAETLAIQCIPPRRRCAKQRWPPPLCCPGSFCYHGVCRQRECGFNTSCRFRSQRCCGGICSSLQADPYNCGGCGQVCPTGYCLDGVCGCPHGLDACGGSCVDFDSDPDNCGGCRQFCETGNCQGGRCGCDQDFTQCGRFCVDLTSDPNNCGACGNVCSTGNCQDSRCGCDQGFDECGGACVDLASDPNHCGRCGHRCGAGQKCAGGQCCQAFGQPCQTADACCDNVPCINGTCHFP